MCVNPLICGGMCPECMEEDATYSFTIDGTLAGLNEYTRANRANRYGGNSCKKDAEAQVMLGIVRADLAPITAPVTLSLRWYEPSNRRDCDNVTFGIKFILDALVKYGILADDSRKFVRGFTHEVLTDKANPRIEVTIEEVGE